MSPVTPPASRGDVACLSTSISKLLLFFWGITSLSAWGVDSFALSHLQGDLYVLDQIGGTPIPNEDGAVETGKFYITTPGCWIEFYCDEKPIRIAPESTFRVQDSSHFQLYDGSALIGIPEETTGMKVSSAKSQCELSAGTAMLEATGNLGLKIISLENEMEIRGNTESRKLLSGELIFLKPFEKGFGMKLDIYLMEMVQTAELLNAYPKPFPSIRKILKEAKLQQMMISGYADATVGDAHTIEEFLLNKQ